VCTNETSLLFSVSELIPEPAFGGTKGTNVDDSGCVSRLRGAPGTLKASVRCHHATYVNLVTKLCSCLYSYVEEIFSFQYTNASPGYAPYLIFISFGGDCMSLFLCG
jgi:hypothetical protein